MAGWLLAALITAALLILAAWTVHGLTRYGLDGKGNASQASGSPSQNGGPP